MDECVGTSGSFWFYEGASDQRKWRTQTRTLDMLDTLDSWDILGMVGMDHRGILNSSMGMVESNMGRVDTDREGNRVQVGDAGGVGGVGDVGDVDDVDGEVDADRVWNSCCLDLCLYLCSGSYPWQCLYSYWSHLILLADLLALWGIQ